MSEPASLYWAAQLGELCARAGHGLAPEWSFLDGWLELAGADSGFLYIDRSGSSEESYTRGLDVDPRAVEGPELGVVSLGDSSALVVNARSADGITVTLAACPANPAQLDELRLVLSLVQQALLRLTEPRAAVIGSAALKAWNDSLGPMLLLTEEFDILAANPAASRVLGLRSGVPLPEWLRRWLSQAIEPDARSGREGWKAGEDGVEYGLSVVSVDPEEVPGRWLVNLTRGGPDLSARIARGGSEFGLTPRELQTFELLAEGLSNRQIAQALGISPATVKFHVIGVMRKAGVGSRTELLAHLHSLHLQDLDAAVPTHAERLSQAWVWEGEYGFVFWIQDQGAEMHGDDVEELYAWIRRQPRSRNRRVYSDATGVRGVDGSAHAATTGECPEIEVAALRGGSAVSRALVNLWLRLTRPAFKARMFRDRRAAIEWLQTWG